jgi:hypothetical protein
MKTTTAIDKAIGIIEHHRRTYYSVQASAPPCEFQRNAQAKVDELNEIITALREVQAGREGNQFVMRLGE